MRLLTHNMLTSKAVKGVQVGYPLTLVVKDIQNVSAIFDPAFIIRLLPRLHYTTLYSAIESLGKTGLIPPELPDNYELDVPLLKRIHHALFEIDIINGEMICPETGRVFTITDGIPNMLLNEDEI